MNLRIRGAEVGDADPLHRLIHAHAEFERTAASCSLGQLRALLSDPAQPAHPAQSVRIFLADTGGEVAGYAAVTLDFSLWRCREWAHLDCLFVDGAYRGQNIGARLLDAARDYAAAAGADQLEWQTPEWNVDAARFYRHNGAEQFPKERFVVRLDQ